MSNTNFHNAYILIIYVTSCYFPNFAAKGLNTFFTGAGFDAAGSLDPAPGDVAEGSLDAGLVGEVGEVGLGNVPGPTFGTAPWPIFGAVARPTFGAVARPTFGVVVEGPVGDVGFAPTAGPNLDATEGAVLGATAGFGATLGSIVGAALGVVPGATLGSIVGAALGVVPGATLGSIVEATLGTTLGATAGENPAGDLGATLGATAVADPAGDLGATLGATAVADPAGDLGATLGATAVAGPAADFGDVGLGAIPGTILGVVAGVTLEAAGGSTFSAWDSFGGVATTGAVSVCSLVDTTTSEGVVGWGASLVEEVWEGVIVSGTGITVKDGFKAMTDASGSILVEEDGWGLVLTGLSAEDSAAVVSEDVGLENGLVVGFWGSGGPISEASNFFFILSNESAPK